MFPAFKKKLHIFLGTTGKLETKTAQQKMKIGVYNAKSASARKPMKRKEKWKK